MLKKLLNAIIKAIAGLLGITLKGISEGPDVLKKEVPKTEPPVGSSGGKTLT